MKTISATEFKAKCLALLDEVHRTGQPLTITKHGKAVATLVSDGEQEAKPWLSLRGKGHLEGDPFEPVLGEDEIEAIQ
jgi:prevent-host-death family protein